MTQGKIEVTPETKVHDLLEAYPELEDVLISIAPPFKKLKNPFLRKTVAKVATVKHISSVGNIPLNELLNKIRTSIGQETQTDSYTDENYFLNQPDWFSADKIALSITEDKVEEKDKMTLVIILKKAREVQEGKIIELITSFLPAPGIDILKSKGYSVWTKKESEDIIKSYFLKNSN